MTADLPSCTGCILLHFQSQTCFTEQCFNNLSEDERAKSLPERFGLTMKHAGVAITITSVTDLLAFGVGATSSLPALRSFAGGSKDN